MPEGTREEPDRRRAQLGGGLGLAAEGAHRLVGERGRVRRGECSELVNEEGGHLCRRQTLRHARCDRAAPASAHATVLHPRQCDTLLHGRTQRRQEAAKEGAGDARAGGGNLSIGGRAHTHEAREHAREPHVKLPCRIHQRVVRRRTAVLSLAGGGQRDAKGLERWQQLRQTRGMREGQRRRLTLIGEVIVKHLEQLDQRHRALVSVERAGAEDTAHRDAHGLAEQVKYHRRCGEQTRRRALGGRHRAHARAEHRRAFSAHVRRQGRVGNLRREHGAHRLEGTVRGTFGTACHQRSQRHWPRLRRAADEGVQRRFHLVYAEREIV